MRTTLFGSVALAALALATPDLSQPGFAQPVPGQSPGQSRGQSEGGPASPPGRQQERPERPDAGNAGGAERGLERAQERQQERQQERSAQPNRPNDDRPDAPRNPRAAEPANPNAPTPSQREAQPTQSNQPRNPAAGSPPATAQPAPSAAPQQPGSTAARTSATPDQQRTINETIERQVERREVRPTRDIGVSVSVGATLPERVRIERLPREVVTVRPQYRDYGVVVTESETVIVDPRTRRVVEVIERGGGRNSESILVERIGRGEVREWRNPRVEIREDVILPADAPLLELPREYVERAPRYRGYRYVASGDEIAIVEPRSRRVVQVIDRKQGRSAREPATTASTGGAAMSSDERAEVNRMLLQRVTPANLFSMRDLRGSTLPGSIDLQKLPAAVAERSSSLRGMSYVLIGDDVLIVDPENRRVVDVIE